MSESLRDLLLAAGLGKKTVEAEQNKSKSNFNRPQQAAKKPQAGSNQRKPFNRARQSAAPKTSAEELDLAKAYAMRSKQDRAERERIEQEARAKAEQKRINKQRMIELLKDVPATDPNADIARNFQHGDKIRRVYVTAENLKQLNSGMLAVVQHLGKYLVVNASVAAEIAVFQPQAVAVLMAEAPATIVDENYVDPKFQVPDDLVW